MYTERVPELPLPRSAPCPNTNAPGRRCRVATRRAMMAATEVPARRPDEHPAPTGSRARSEDDGAGARTELERPRQSPSRSRRGVPAGRRMRDHHAIAPEPRTLPMFNSGMSFALGEEIEALRDMVHRFAQAKIAPRASRESTKRTSSRAICGKSSVRSGCTVSPSMRYLRRRRHGLPRPRGRDGGGEPGVGFGRALLRRALEPLREPDPEERQRRAARALPPRPRSPASTWAHSR